MSLPGGRLEPGEDWIAGALRELAEMTSDPQPLAEALGQKHDAIEHGRVRLPSHRCDRFVFVVVQIQLLNALGRLGKTAPNHHFFVKIFRLMSHPADI